MTSASAVQEDVEIHKGSEKAQSAEDAAMAAMARSLSEASALREIV